MSKPIVLHFIGRLTVGGAETVVSRLVSYLKGGKYEPLVCSLRSGPLQAAIEKHGVEVIVCHIARRSIVLFPLFVTDIIRIVATLCWLVRRRRVAIIHTHLPDCAILGGVTGKLSGVRVVSTYHGPENIVLVGRHGPIRTLLRRFFCRLAGACADRVIAVSEQVKGLLCGPMQVPPHKVVVISNGVDLPAFERACALAPSPPLPRSHSDHGHIVMCVGRLVANKGQEVLIRAAPEVMRRYPDTTFVLVGDGPARGELEALVTQLRLENAVQFLGERSDVPALLGFADVFVLPSFIEGTSVALIEAMAAGKPVVATAVAGNLDVVVENETGVFTPAKDAKALAEAICYLLANPALAKQMGIQGATRVKERFDLQKIARETERIYDELLSVQVSAR